MHLKLLKTAGATGDSIGYKITDEITKVSRNSQQINSETVTSEHYQEISKERYKSSGERQKIIDDLRLIS